ncbi:hypothetical protein OX283_003435 [Flavobacterium sp. SUN052]|uniref:hypothetical protein n=1 Tax=Flavobacterium sp. SUN052 TaxID=3002441 RepID=UPI00237ED582|nr:hypothetical protein [Flavobacterium sp. SUN052]MEC4003695.1 hypothetical protein [Flavobacterium sp. SUN052]
MMKSILILILGFTLFSCQKKENSKLDIKQVTKDSTASNKDKQFEMYQMSEMAALMEQMYAHNLALKKRIVDGDTIGKYPDFFNQIYTAKFTTANDNDLFFQDNAKKYIVAQKLIYSDTKNIKQHFNDGVNACITCHKGKCGGPISRIKKLFIK